MGRIQTPGGVDADASRFLQEWQGLEQVVGTSCPRQRLPDVITDCHHNMGYIALPRRR